MADKRWFLLGLITALVVGLCFPAQAATLYVSEFAAGVSSDGTTVAPILPQPAVADQVVTFTTTTQSAAFNASTHAVLLVCSADCSIRFGSDPTATTSNYFLKANVPIAFGVIPGIKVAVVANP